MNLAVPRLYVTYIKKTPTSYDVRVQFLRTHFYYGYGKGIQFNNVNYCTNFARGKSKLHELYRNLNFIALEHFQRVY